MRGVSGWCWSVQIESVVAVAVASDVVLPDQVAAEDVLDTLAAARLLLAVHSGQNFMGGNLTTLAPDIVAAILDDAMPNHVTLFDLAVDPPALWDDQRARLR